MRTTKQGNGRNFGRPQQPNEYDYERHPRTWLIATSTAQRIDKIAENQNLGKSDLVNFLLSSAVQMLDEGQLEIKKKSVLERIDFSP